MKAVYLIGGPMGVGKTTVCQALKTMLPRCVFLDGDWCWDMHPFQVTDDTKRMVLENIVFLLNQFIHCPAYENIVFGWVMHQQGIIDAITGRLDAAECRIETISLLCSEEALVARLQRDVSDGKRSPDVIARSVERLPMYETLDTRKVDTTGKRAQEVAREILGCG